MPGERAVLPPPPRWGGQWAPEGGLYYLSTGSGLLFDWAGAYIVGMTVFFNFSNLIREIIKICGQRRQKIKMFLED